MERETHLQMDIFLMNINFPHKISPSTVFRNSSVSEALKNNQSQKINMPYFVMAYSAPLHSPL